MGLNHSNPKLFPGDIVEYPRNKYFSHFGIYFGERDGVPYVAHLTCRGQRLSEIKLDPLEMLGTKYKVKQTWILQLRPFQFKRLTLRGVCLQVNNMLDDTHSPRDFHSVVKPAIEDMMGREVTFDMLFHNSEHQATLFRYGVKKSQQVSRAAGGEEYGLKVGGG
ncbi:hypothetical protein GOODEAATRI_005153 [Goodea atripinnis]|uniref:LRAT domain-containing protein n=1 Tax=Goodea atripinnis TaxID=208336 RepID=A0ABV0MPH5_9TELE